MRSARYRIRTKSVDFVVKHGVDTSHPDASAAWPYGIWDTERHGWVDRWGVPDPDEEYFTCCRDVALMRRRYLTYLTREAEARAEARA